MGYIITALDFMLSGYTLYIVLLLEAVWAISCYRDNKDSSDRFWGTVSVAVMLASIYYAYPGLQGWFLADPLWHAIYFFGGYVLVGFLVATMNWCFMLSRYREFVRKTHLKFSDKVKEDGYFHDISLNTFGGSSVPDAYRQAKVCKNGGENGRAFNIYLYNQLWRSSTRNFWDDRMPEVEYVDGITRPKVMGDYVTMWWALWPIAAVNVVADPAELFFRTMVKGMTGWFTILRDKLAGDHTRYL